MSAEVRETEPRYYWFCEKCSDCGETVESEDTAQRYADEHDDLNHLGGPTPDQFDDPIDRLRRRRLLRLRTGNSEATP